MVLLLEQRCTFEKRSNECCTYPPWLLATSTNMLKIPSTIFVGVVSCISLPNLALAKKEQDVKQKVSDFYCGYSLSEKGDGILWV